MAASSSPYSQLGAPQSECATIASVTGDGAYDTKDVYEACARRNAIAIIPPRKGAQLRKSAAFAVRNEAVKACRRFGREIWKHWSSYHRRSLVET